MQANSRITSWWAALLILWLVAAAPAGPIDHVVIVSLDGAQPDYVLAGPCTNIQAMAAAGAYTWKAQTVTPSVTLISHAAMLSGCQSAKHGIDWNGWNPSKGYVKSSTCFEIVKKSGRRTAMFVGKEKLRHLAKPDTVDQFVTLGGSAEKISLAAAAAFQTNPPALMFVHYPDPDAAGHAHGWGSSNYLAALQTCDRGIGILRLAAEQAGLADCTLFIVTADHGGHERSHGTKDPRDMTIPWIAGSPGNLRPGEIQAAVSTCDTAATAVYALGLDIDPQWDGRAIVEIFADHKAIHARLRPAAFMVLPDRPLVAGIR